MLVMKICVQEKAGLQDLIGGSPPESLKGYIVKVETLWEL